MSLWTTISNELNETGLDTDGQKLSPYYQHLAKGKIFQVVQELEWEWLSSDPQTYTSPTSGSVSPAVSTPTPPPPPPPPLTQQEDNSLSVSDLSTFFTEFNPSSGCPQNPTPRVEES
ncbi:unnamed protein product [Parnassius apollo]|uniref:(apollo) hypothetical protein n=1 Tax=Parnassius apollo TaxID=110799 RepID=A0A8S3XH33_PARAO|nr:unnamed protein product [Parnassius apollo]